RPLVRALPPSGARIIFASRLSAAGFLAPYRSLERLGFALDGATIDFTGPYPQEERVVLGVLYGAYDAGGISLERLQALERAGIVRTGELDVLCEGEAFPEIVLAYNPASYTAERKNFARCLPGVVDRAPRYLRQELAALGIACFYTPRADDINLIKRLRTMVPPPFVADHPDGAVSRR
ncbi:MAG: PhnD/SsuA/transferrin family substrate-binding protein, partial [Candidatus Krumholzibacteria bacterium]|nr:PhnD/SsuA/transferrin family substrate-binding protein [Candidatus Krumholzibacteria bacterium]